MRYYFWPDESLVLLSHEHSFKHPHGKAVATVTALATDESASSSSSQQHDSLSFSAQQLFLLTCSDAASAQQAPFAAEQQSPFSALQAAVAEAQHFPEPPAQQSPSLAEVATLSELQQSLAAGAFRMATNEALSMPSLQQLGLLVAASDEQQLPSVDAAWLNSWLA